MRIEKPELEWNGTLRELERVEKLIQHHMAHPSWDFRDVHEFHRDSRGWAGIGYNYWIGFDGTIYEGRGLHVGAHAGSNWNGRSLGIGYQGHFEEQEMTDEQLEAGAWLNARFIEDFDLSIADIIGHREVSSTACPGSNFKMAELKERTERALAGDGPWEDPGGGEPGEGEPGTPGSLWNRILSFLGDLIGRLLRFFQG